MDAPIEEKIVVSNTLGLHARVATMIVQKMQNYDCQVSLTLHGVEVNARSVLGLLLLAASPRWHDDAGRPDLDVELDLLALLERLLLVMGVIGPIR